MFSTFLCGEQAVFYVKCTVSTPCDTSQKELEVKMEKTKTTCSFGNDEYGLQMGNVKISELHDLKVIRLRWSRIFSSLN